MLHLLQAFMLIRTQFEMRQPKKKSEIRCFLGMINQFLKFVENLLEKTEPLRSLLHGKNEGFWGE